MGPLFCSEEQHGLLELEGQPLVTNVVSSSQPPDVSKRRYLPLAACLILTCGGILLLHVRSHTSVHNSKLLNTLSLTGGEDTTFIPYLGYNCYPNFGAWGSDCGDLLSTSPETCAAKCSGCPGCQSYTVSQPDADGRVDCWTHSWTTVSECGQNTSYSTYVRVCGKYQCPDGFQLKSGSYQLQRPRPGVCCEEALCSCGHGRSGFFCNQQVWDNNCGEEFECALDPSLTWRYSTDRFVACKRLARLEPSRAPLHSFYVYRSARDGEDVNSGINVANAAADVAPMVSTGTGGSMMICSGTASPALAHLFSGENVTPTVSSAIPADCARRPILLRAPKTAPTSSNRRAPFQLGSFAAFLT